MKPGTLATASAPLPQLLALRVQPRHLDKASAQRQVVPDRVLPVGLRCGQDQAPVHADKLRGWEHGKQSRARHTFACALGDAGRCPRSLRRATTASSSRGPPLRSQPHVRRAARTCSAAKGQCVCARARACTMSGTHRVDLSQDLLQRPPLVRCGVDGHRDQRGVGRGARGALRRPPERAALWQHHRGWRRWRGEGRRSGEGA